MAEAILSQLDSRSLLSVERVSRGWQWAVARHQLWRKLLLYRLKTDPVWRSLAERRGWLEVVQSAGAGCGNGGSCGVERSGFWDSCGDVSCLPLALERRRAALGLRQRLADFPLLSEQSPGTTGASGDCGGGKSLSANLP
ncbi:unnamed protein product [Protopolystoma xenopodis]|uniref:F-box domain-containing protein n=1 Tax=Protopolystoma xenopodis TaxID=117903 RepID=A0A448X5Y8_9PLAT|nr:unnamed protein product [Protopolystoma xenopodis]